MAIDIVIQGDYKDRDIKRAHRDLDLLGKQSGTTGAAFTKMSGFAVGMGAAVGAAALGAAAAGARMAVSLGVDGVKAAIEDEAAVSKLAQTMTNLGLAHDTAQVEASIASMETELGIVDMELRPAYDRLVRSIGTTDGAMKAMSLAADISAGTGKSLDAVVQALGRAYDGNTQGLSRLGAGLSATLLKSGDMKAITERLSATFGGQATTQAETYEGQIKRLGLQFDNLKEAFGAGFLQALGATEGKTGDLLQAMEDLKPALEDVGEAVGDLVVDLAGLVVAADKASKAGKRFFDDPNWVDLGDLILGAARSNKFFNSTLVQSIPVIGPAVNLLLELTGAYDALAGASQDAYGGVSRTAMALGKGTPDISASSAATSRWTGYAESLGGVVKTTGGNLVKYFAKVESVARASGSAADKTVILTQKQKNLAERWLGHRVPCRR
jgi:hypothetical protein